MDLSWSTDADANKKIIINHKKRRGQRLLPFHNINYPECELPSI
jgi:hypothetical protein